MPGTTPPIFVDGDPATASMLQALGSEVTLYTPTLTAATANPNLGTDPERNGMWVQIGPLCHVWFEIQFGTGGSVSAGTGQYRVGLPVPVLDGGLTRVTLGSGRAIDASVATDLGSSLLEAEMLANEPTKAIFATEEGVSVTASVPHTWASGDELFAHLVYPGDFS